MMMNPGSAKACELIKSVERKFLSRKYNNKLSTGDINAASAEMVRYFDKKLKMYNLPIVVRAVDYTIDNLQREMENLEKDHPLYHDHLLPRVHVLRKHLREYRDGISEHANDYKLR